MDSSCQKTKVAVMTHMKEKLLVNLAWAVVVDFYCTWHDNWRQRVATYDHPRWFPAALWFSFVLMHSFFFSIDTKDNLGIQQLHCSSHNYNTSIQLGYVYSVWYNRHHFIYWKTWAKFTLWYMIADQFCKMTMLNKSWYTWNVYIPIPHGSVVCASNHHHKDIITLIKFGQLPF